MNEMPTPQELVDKGFYLFPCVLPWKNGKLQKIPCKGVKWKEQSTKDLAIIEGWKKQFPNCHWAIDTGKSGLAVLDEDSGKEHRDIIRQKLLEWELEYGSLPVTFTVQTPSGGFHYYYWGLIKTDSNALCLGLDTRGKGGMVVAPGSGGYKIFSNGGISPVPEWLVKLAGLPKERKEGEGRITPVSPLDDDYSIKRAVAYLKTEIPATEGFGGDKWTLLVAERVKDFGVSEEKTLELMLDYWNPRCYPPWDIEDLGIKVFNAYEYGQFPPGVSHPSAAGFSEFIDPDPPKAPAPRASLFIEGNELLKREIKIDYLIHGLIETPSTGLVFGDPSAGKSFMAIDMAMGVACGTSWMGAVARKGTAVYFAGEGRQGVQRRIAAWRAHYGIDIPYGGIWVSEKRIEFDAKALSLAADDLKYIQDKTGNGIDVMFIDTLARHMPSQGDENSARDMGGFVNSCDWLRDSFNSVATVVHHSGKANKDNSRGSSAIRGAMDWELRVINEGKMRTVVFTKQKEAELPKPMSFILKSIDIGNGVASAVPVPCTYDPTHGKVANLSADGQLAYSILQFAISEGGKGYLTEKEWQKAFYEALSDNVSQDSKKQKFSRIKKKLVESVTIRYEGDKVFDLCVNTDCDLD